MIKRRRLVKDSSIPIEDLLVMTDNKYGITLDHAIDDLKRDKGYNDSLLGDNYAIGLLMRRFGLEHRDVIRVLNYKFDGRYLKDSIVRDEEPVTYYGLFQRGGSIGANANAEYRRYGDGILLEVYLDREEAKAKAKRYRKYLTPGERSYYGMGYTVKPLTKSELKNAYVQKLIAELDKGNRFNDSKKKRFKDSDPEYTYEFDYSTDWEGFDKSYEEEVQDISMQAEEYGCTLVDWKKLKGVPNCNIRIKVKGTKGKLKRLFRDLGIEDWDSFNKKLVKVRDSIGEVPEENKKALEEFTEWEGIIGYDDDIVDVYESGCAYVDGEYIDYGDSYDALDAYLEWEGILGYTDAIYNILKNGYDSVYYDDMVADRDSYDE